MRLLIHIAARCSIIFYLINVSSQNELESAVVQGRQKCEEFSQKVSLFGSCWKSAIENLHLGCQHLTDEVQSRLALAFANCFLEHSGSKTCPCTTEQRISECLADSDDRIFSTYREFYTHTRSICHFLQHQVWQERTQATVRKLSTHSEKVSQQLKKTSKSQTAILHLQHIALSKQQLLINNSEKGLQDLSVELEKSRTNARAVMEDFRSATDEQKLLIFHVFDHIKKLEALVMRQFTGFYAIVYYFVVVVLYYVLTSTRQTSDARFWLYLLVVFSIITERIIVSCSIDEESEQRVLLDSAGPVYSRVWLCRQIYIGVSFVVLVISIYRYKDYDIINNRLLLRIQNQQQEILNSVQKLSGHGQKSEIQIEVLKQAFNKGDDSIVEKKIFEVKDKKVKDTFQSVQPQPKKNQSIKVSTPKRNNTPSQTLLNPLNSCRSSDVSINNSENLQETPRSTRYNLRQRPRSGPVERTTVFTPRSVARHLLTATKTIEETNKVVQNLFKEGK